MQDDGPSGGDDYNAALEDARRRRWVSLVRTKFELRACRLVRTATARQVVRAWRFGRLTAGVCASAPEVRDLAPVSLLRGVGLITSSQEPFAPHQRSHRNDRQNEDQPDD
jgi:hypothetical protein